MTTHRFLAVTDRHSDKLGTVTYRALCTCGHRTAATHDRAAALTALDVHMVGAAK